MNINSSYFCVSSECSKWCIFIFCSLEFLSWALLPVMTADISYFKCFNCSINLFFPLFNYYCVFAAEITKLCLVSWVCSHMYCRRISKAFFSLQLKFSAVRSLCLCSVFSPLGPLTSFISMILSVRLLLRRMHSLTRPPASFSASTAPLWVTSLTSVSFTRTIQSFTLHNIKQICRLTCIRDK